MSEVTSYLVTGDWRHIVDDGMVDPDALPDEVSLTGKVDFHPVGPAVITAGAPETAYTLGPVTALVADGQLRDLQGRDGVWLAGTVGGTPVLWSATTEVFHQGERVPYPVVEFQIDEDLRLTALYEHTFVYPPPVVSEVAELRAKAVAAAERAERSANEFDLSMSTVSLPAEADATVTLSGDGPDYSVEIGIPRPVWAGDAGDLPPTGVAGVLYTTFEDRLLPS